MEKNEVMNDEINIFDLIEKLWKGWRYLLGGLLGGLLIAATAFFQLPDKFEAVAIIQVGQVSSVLVEQPSLAVERIGSPAFQLAVAQQLKDGTWIQALSESSVAAASPLAVQVMKTAPLIKLKTTAKSPSHASAIINAVIKDLKNKHDELASPMVEKLRADLAINKERLLKVQKESESLQKLTADAPVREDLFSQLLLLTSLKQQKEKEVFELRQAILVGEAALLPPVTQSTAVFGGISVSSNPVSPKKSWFVVAALGGLLMGVLVLFVTEAGMRWRQEKRCSSRDSEN